MIQCLRIFLPRRRETVFRNFLILLIVFACVTLISFRFNLRFFFQDGVQKDLVEDEKTEQIRQESDREKRQLDHEKTREIFAGDSKMKRTGPGENGAAVSLTEEEMKQADTLMKKWFFNIVASDKVSMDRTIPDTRPNECKVLKFDKDLPNASVIIIFTNEAWSPLVRTIHSVINRSPPDLLHEIVLLDDSSDREELGEKLENYIKQFKKVKLVRKKERQGLIRARLEGAKAATGDILVFLDSHCEANIGWLEPLLQRIHDKRSAVLCPIIDMVNAETMSYWGGPANGVGSFWWSLHFKMMTIPEREKQRRKSEADPIRSPTMAGGLFAAERKYFFEIGGYDPGMEIWGGENLEISFRTWMCGGSLEYMPCSRVGHIFRAGHPYNMTGEKSGDDAHGLNSARLAEVWLDDYKRLYYNFRQQLKHMDIGDISERKAIRQRLKCHSFKWYLENVIPEKFIPDEKVLAWGMVKNMATSLCWDTLQRHDTARNPIGVFECQSGGSTSQMFSLSREWEIRREEICLDTPAKIDPENQKIFFGECGESHLQQHWNHTRNGQIIHTATGLCVDLQGIKSGQDLLLKACNPNAESQKWTWHHYLELK